MASGLDIKVLEGAVITVSGDLVTLNIPQVDVDALVAQLVQSKSFLDLGNIGVMDTAGLAWVVYIVGKVKCSGKTISIVKAPSQLLKLAEISELTESLPLE